MMFDYKDPSNILNVLTHCCQYDQASGCKSCPVSETCSGMGMDWLNKGLIPIISALPASDQRDRFVEVLSACVSCEEECDGSCPYYSEFGEEVITDYYRKIHSFLQESGVY